MYLLRLEIGGDLYVEISLLFKYIFVMHNGVVTKKNSADSMTIRGIKMDEITLKGEPYNVNGMDYYFNHCVFKERFNDICWKAHKKKKDFVEELAERVGAGSIDTVNDWKKGRHSPQTYEVVQRIAAVFDTDPVKLLIPVETKGETMKVNINMDAKNAARRLYAELCELIDSLGWVGFFVPGEPDFRQDREFNPYSHEYVHSLRLKSHEDYRHYLYKEIRKTTLDLSEEFRKSLEEFVDECIGPEDFDEPEFQYFHSEKYKEWLKNNNAVDDDGSRYVYSSDHCQNMYEKMNEIFRDFICQ